MAPVSKGNAHSIQWRGAKRRIVNSDKAHAFMYAATLWFRTHPPPFKIDPNDKLSLCVSIAYPNYKQDADIELVADALQESGIVPNDRQFREKHVYVEDETRFQQTVVAIHVIGVLPWKSKTRVK
jgi:hypothetical protein